MTIDAWGQPVVADPGSVDAWNRAWMQLLHFEGDPLATLAANNEHDDSFVLGPVFAAIYSVLGGVPVDSPVVVTSLKRARSRLGNDDRERRFIAATDFVVAGDFSRGAAVLDTISAERADLAATRIAHDLYLHVGDNAARLKSSSAALAHWAPGVPGASFVRGQHAFALEELDMFDEAERFGREAIDADPRDLWARHALAHVYESTGSIDAGVALLDESVDVWTHQDSLAAHIWWHLELFHLAAGRIDAILDIHDRLVLDTSSPFRLCDLTSMLWRLELRGHDVGDRWRPIADRWATTTEQHTCAFLDVHAAMAYARCADHETAPLWHDALRSAWDGVDSQNARTFQSIVRPIAEAFAAFGRGDFTRSSLLFDTVAGQTARIGGSNVQRDILTATHRAAKARCSEPTIEPKS